MSEEELTELQARNAVRMAAAREWLGSRWLLHPNNSATNRSRQRIAVIEAFTKREAAK